MFEPRDLWVGVFWDRRDDGLHVYVCLFPTLVLHVVKCRQDWQEHWPDFHPDSRYWECLRCGVVR